MGCIQSGPSILVDGRTYRVVENIGEGGFSQVDLCRAEEKGTGGQHQPCVAKRILCHSQADTEKALREAGHHRRLRHPNLLPCLGHAVGQPLSPTATAVAEVTLLLPYHRRGTLAEELELARIAKASLGLPRILSTFAGICSGLAAMHAAGLAHRDLKTGNVLLGDDSGQPVIMDFGSATDKLVWINTRQEAARWQDYAAEHCSMTYRAPELFNVPCPGVISEKADIWSLGCILYALCYNESPFDQVYCRGDSVALATCSGIKVPAASVESNHPPELLQLIRDMGSPDAASRPSLAEIAEAMAPLLAATGLPVMTLTTEAEAPPVSPAGDKGAVRTTVVAGGARPTSVGDVRLVAPSSSENVQHA